MFIRRRRGWEIPESRVTPEAAALGRRAALGAGLGAGAGLAALGTARAAHAWSLFDSGPSASPVPLRPLPARPNPRYVAGRKLTPADAAESYNNFYEFGESKSVADEAQALRVAPWSIELAGMVRTPRTIGLDDLLKQVSLEERVYRHRCVEAWAMTVPWTGFPLADLVRLAEPLGSATYLKFTTLADPKQMPGLHKPWYPWPYTEGLTMQEAMNELAFLSVGLYGKTLPPQNGAPIRLTVPWKYGFKSAKSVVRVEFTDKRPETFWQRMQDSEYGFWANVNPAVPHPRWSQAEERLIGSNETVPTQIWNGYGEFVAAMYADKTKERLFA
ncbi:MAG TPA: protein-methionine-sulfoxide reductase catalytic subunit MsrP [Acetobacteraceae bacterium]|nr:protein-methionine-sulfoxide reductase catalytic subunit MsrP [Acetobacteraceae bacterium]